MEWKEKNVLVIGTGISGIAATDLLIQVGAKVFLFDGNEEIKEEDVKGKLQSQEGVRVLLGEASLTQEVRNVIDVVVISPGVPLTILW